MTLAAAVPASVVAAHPNQPATNYYLRLQPTIHAVCISGEYTYFSKVSPAGQFTIDRWRTNADEFPVGVCGAWDDQRDPWELKPLPDGKVLAWTPCGCVAILG